MKPQRILMWFVWISLILASPKAFSILFSGDWWMLVAGASVTGFLFALPYLDRDS